MRADQPENARAAAAGAARVLPLGELTAAGVRVALRAILEEPAYRASARRLQAELHGLPPMEHTVHLLGGLAPASPPDPPA